MLRAMICFFMERTSLRKRSRSWSAADASGASVGRDAAPCPSTVLPVIAGRMATASIRKKGLFILVLTNVDQSAQRLVGFVVLNQRWHGLSGRRKAPVGLFIVPILDLTKEIQFLSAQFVSDSNIIAGA